MNPQLQETEGWQYSHGQESLGEPPEENQALAGTLTAAGRDWRAQLSRAQAPDPKDW